MYNKSTLTIEVNKDENAIEIFCVNEEFDKAELTELIKSLTGYRDNLKEKINNCPMCRSKVNISTNTMGLYWITCDSCGITTTLFENRDTLLNYWNKDEN